MGAWLLADHFAGKKIKVTPAMSLGIAEHPITMREIPEFPYRKISMYK
ncbi:MAG: hypothetical protein FWG58_02585 [Methanomassiliicoccaceae archaeon]|nr:hypothetical protein [Methanomassiliicoccaceae archaeon]